MSGYIVENRLGRAREFAALAAYVVRSQMWVHAEGELTEDEQRGLYEPCARLGPGC